MQRSDLGSIGDDLRDMMMRPWWRKLARIASLGGNTEKMKVKTNGVHKCWRFGETSEAVCAM